MAAAGAAVAVVLASYLPVLRLPPVGEDLQWALRGATVLRSPGVLLRPFHEHLRPAGDAFFAAGVAMFDTQWGGYRAVQLAIAAALALAGWALARRLLRGGVWTAALLVPLWLVCPLVTEVFCVTNQVKQMLLGIGILGVLLLRGPAPSRRRRVAIAALALLAAAAKEEWVVLPVLVALQDILVLAVTPRRAVRRMLPWLAAVAVYLVAYDLLVAFRARWFFETTAAAGAAKLVASLSSMWHVGDPLPLGFSSLLQDNSGGAAAAVTLTAAVVAALVASRSGPGLFAVTAAGVLLLPTALSPLQAGRYLLLPWFFMLVAVVEAGRRLASRPRLRGAVAAAGGLLAIAVVARDAGVVWRDLDDWAAYGALQRRVRDEAAPLLAAARSGMALVVLRGDDGAPLAALATAPAGNAKLYFPRPDDPYGVASLQALMTWELRRAGLALERVREVDGGRPAAAFVHHAGGFVELPAVPQVAVRFPAEPARGGVRGVVLVPVPWTSFAPEAFP